MTERELASMHGDLLQVVPVKEHDENPKIIQARPVVRIHSVNIGSGWHGKNIRLSFHHPERSDTLAGVDSTTGELIFTSAQIAETKSRGKIHASDHPLTDKHILMHETDVAVVHGPLLQHVKGTMREHYPLKPVRQTQSKRAKRNVVGADGVPF